MNDRHFMALKLNNSIHISTIIHFTTIFALKHGILEFIGTPVVCQKIDLLFWKSILHTYLNSGKKL